MMVTMTDHLNSRPRRHKPAARSRIVSGVASVVATLALGTYMASGALTSASAAPRVAASAAPATSTVVVRGDDDQPGTSFSASTGTVASSSSAQTSTSAS
jgi:hypothetical protein